MRKEPFLPYWMRLERVIPVVQTQTASNLILTLVSVELYAGVSDGFLLIFNGRSETKQGVSDRGGRGWIRARISDDLGNQYHSMLTMLSGIEDTHGFRGRAGGLCGMPCL